MNVKNKGFTLIELLVVVAIIGILAAFGVVSYNNFTSSAKLNLVKNNFNELINFIKINYTKCESGQSVILNDQSGNPKDVTSSFCGNSALGACSVLATHFKSLSWKNPYSDYFIINNRDSEWTLHCSNQGYPSAQLNERAGYIFINNVSGEPQTMRLTMRWDNDYSGDWSSRYSRANITIR